MWLRFEAIWEDGTHEVMFEVKHKKESQEQGTKAHCPYAWVVRVKAPRADLVLRKHDYYCEYIYDYNYCTLREQRWTWQA